MSTLSTVGAVVGSGEVGV